jgi:hypothetical protein
MHHSIVLVLTALLATACGQTAGEPASTTPAAVSTEQVASAPTPPPTAAFSCDALIGHVVDLYADSPTPPVDERTRVPLIAGCEKTQAGEGWSELQPAAECSLAADDEAALLECGFGALMPAFMRAAL